MNKNLLAVIFLAFSTALFSQWNVYDASALPTDSSPAFSGSCNSPGVDFSASVIADPDIAGNSLLQYLSPDVDGRQAYKLTPDAWTGFTAVIRMKAYPNIDTLNHLFDIEIRNEDSGLREKLFVKYNGDVELDYAGGTTNVDVQEWHIYRITMSGGDVAVYIDEDSTPVITGVTTSSATAYEFKVADCSGGNSQGAIVDWIAWTGDGAFAPAAGPALPSDLFTGGSSNTPGLVAKYSMEGSGEVVTESIEGADGMMMNAFGITREDCGINNSINFSGAGNAGAMIWVEDAPQINFDGSSSFSISVWTKIDPFTNTSEMTLMLKGDNTNDGSHLPNGNGHWYTLATKDNELRFALDDDVVKTQLGVVIDETMFPPSEWNHIVGVVDTDVDSIFLYLNGAKIGSLLNETDADMSTTGLPLVIGNYHSVPRKINGIIDELEIHDQALSADTIAMMYANATPTNTCNVLETIAGASSDATLSDLSVDVGTLQPAFAPNVFDYTVEVPFGTSQFVVLAIANHPNAMATGGGVFNSFPTTVTITVTAEDGITTQEYTVNIEVSTSTDDLEAAKIALKTFPNPIKNLTNFSFYLEEAADVNLKIYDLMGREIQTVVDSRLASGDHTLQTSTEHLQSGVYIYRFVSNGVIIAKKMIKNE